MQSIQIYAKTVRVEAENDTSIVTLTDVEIGDVVAQYNTIELLEAIYASDGFSDMTDFVTKRLAENE